MGEGKSSGTPTKWWHWVLLYPTLLVAIIGAIPTYIQLFQSFQLGVPYRKVDTATEQAKIWSENWQCLTNRPFEKITTVQNVTVSAIGCPNGYLLISLKPADAKEVYHWLSIKDLLGMQEATQGRGKAIASETYLKPQRIAQVGRTIICQRWLRSGLILLRVKYDDGRCSDETINTYTGAVMSSVPAPCDPNC